MTGTITLTVGVTAGVSDSVPIPSGFTLVGVRVPEMTSISFTISHADGIGGTYSIIRDPLGLITGTAGTDITFTMTATSLGTWVIPPTVSALLNSFMKVTFSSSESAGIQLIFKSIA